MIEQKILKLLCYCYHLSPNPLAFKYLKMNDSFQDTQTMIHGVNMIYEIMYCCSNEIAIIMDEVIGVSHIGKVFNEYLWSSWIGKC